MLPETSAIAVVGLKWPRAIKGFVCIDHIVRFLGFSAVSFD
jgi:hypothetical protein